MRVIEFYWDERAHSIIFKILQYTMNSQKRYLLNISFFRFSVLQEHFNIYFTQPLLQWMQTATFGICVCLAVEYFRQWKSVSELEVALFEIQNQGGSLYYLLQALKSLSICPILHIDLEIEYIQRGWKKGNNANNTLQYHIYCRKLHQKTISLKRSMKAPTSEWEPTRYDSLQLET